MGHPVGDIVLHYVILAPNSFTFAADRPTEKMSSKVKGGKPKKKKEGEIEEKQSTLHINRLSQNYALQVYGRILGRPIIWQSNDKG